MFTDKMTMLVAPSATRVSEGSRGAGVYAWEKENTLKVTRVTMQVRTREGEATKTLAWAEKETLGMTVKNGKLRLWGKGSKSFFSLDDVSRFGQEGMESLIQGFLERHGFVTIGTAVESLTWAYAPDACALFGVEIVQNVARKMEDGLSFAVIKKADVELFLNTIRVAGNYRDVAREALKHQDYKNLRKIVIASSIGYAGDAHTFLDLPFTCTERPDQGLTVYAARTKVIPQEVMPLAIRGYDNRDTIWEVNGQPLDMVPFNTGDDPATWVAAVHAMYKTQCQLEREARHLEHLEIMARQCVRDLEKAQDHLTWLSHEEIESDLLRWQEDGLLDQDERGLLVWKAVTKDRRGVLGYQYTMNEPFVNGGMAAVGPWGAVKEYGSKDTYVMAMRITDGGPVHATQRPGVWYAIKGVPVAQYLITEMTEDGFVPVLVAGTDEMAILTGIPSKKGDMPTSSDFGKDIDGDIF